MIHRILNLIERKLRKPFGLLTPGKTGGQNIYHCCIQKSGSQWIKSLLADRLIYKTSHMNIYIPHKNFLGADSVQDLIDNPLPVHKIITPLYIEFEDFLKIPKPDKFKAFFIMRDPRDLLISWYFSSKYSHPKNPSVKKHREILSKMNDETAIGYVAKQVYHRNNNLYRAMRNWYLQGKEKENIMVIRYEELIGEEKIETFKRMLDHVNIRLSKKDIKKLLEKYSFKRLSRGRETGVENRKSHYRKGISGDWQNYFSEEHKKIFKEENGQLLIDLDYEKDLLW